MLNRLLWRSRFNALEWCNRQFSAVGRGPVWTSAELPWLEDLNAATGVIGEEFAQYVQQGGKVPGIAETDRGSDQVYGKERWDMLHMYLLGIKIDPICKQFPRTMQALARVPNLCHAKFSVLGADRHHVPVHRDAYNGVLRLHLPLTVPAGDCYIKVAGQRVDWQVGKPFAFDPGCQHEVVKQAAQERVILIADFLRPGPDWLHRWSKDTYAGFARKAEIQRVLQRYRDIFGNW